MNLAMGDEIISRYRQRIEMTEEDRYTKIISILGHRQWPL